MKFEEILPHIKNHEKVYRLGWYGDDGASFDESPAYIVLSNRGARYLYLYENEKLVDDCYTLSGFDITSDDWEIFPQKNSQKIWNYQKLSISLHC